MHDIYRFPLVSKLQSRTAGNRHSSLVVHLKSSQVGQQPWPGSITLRSPCNSVTGIMDLGEGRLANSHTLSHILTYFEIFTLSTLSPTGTLKWPGRNGVQITCNTSDTYHVQHTVCRVVWRNSSAMKFDRVEITFLLLYSIG